ncbi:protein of unknown function (plasmid) [Rhodovastum atsumiense]|nr:protein of unknown function [Rhodovastum atsumiense]
MPAWASCCSMAGRSRLNASKVSRRSSIICTPTPLSRKDSRTSTRPSSSGCNATVTVWLPSCRARATRTATISPAPVTRWGGTGVSVWPVAEGMVEDAVEATVAGWAGECAITCAAVCVTDDMVGQPSTGAVLVLPPEGVVMVDCAVLPDEADPAAEAGSAGEAVGGSARDAASTGPPATGRKNGWKA